jgi:hypothetical protein
MNRVFQFLDEQGSRYDDVYSCITVRKQLMPINHICKYGQE